MDRNKRITGIVFAGIIALAITACKVQLPGYVSLYVDNSRSVYDTIDPGDGPVDMVDTTMAPVVDTTVGIEAELPVFLRPSEDLFKISSDRAYQNEVNELLKSITDSIQLLRRQIIELQNQDVLKPDTSFPDKTIHQDHQLDSLQPEFEMKQLIQVKNDTIAMLRNQVTMLNKSAGLKADTVYITKEIVKLIKGDSLQADYETTRMLQAKNDTIAFLRKQVHEIQNNDGIKADTIYVFKETSLLPVAEGWQTDPMTLQLIRAKDEQIQMLQNRLNAMQTAAATTPQQTQIIREPAQAQAFGSQQTDLMSLQLIKAKDDQIQMLQNRLNAMQTAAATTPQQTQIIREPAQAQLPGSQENDPLTLQLLQTKNDTILFLRSQLHNLQRQSPTKDTVFVENEGKEMQPAKELVSKQETSDLFQALQDTMQLLKNMVLSLEEHIIPVMDTTALSGQDKKDVPSAVTTDTILLVAYYELGEIEPLEEESILEQIKELCSNKNVTKIALSGYTDSSGNELINKEITNARLNYLLESIIPWIAKEKVFFQNFGDAFASDSVVINERRIEIRINTK